MMTGKKAIAVAALFLFMNTAVFSQENEEAGTATVPVTAEEQAPEEVRGGKEAGGIVREAEEAAVRVEREVETAEEAAGLDRMWQRIVAALAIILAQSAAIWFLWRRIYPWVAKKALTWGTARLKPLSIKKLHLLSVTQILGVVEFLLKALKYIVTAFQLFLTLPIVFSLFPQTRHFADFLFSSIFTPVKSIFFGAVGFLPNLFAIAVILFVFRYVLRSLKFFATQIEKGRLVLPGFYPDWTWPTFNILRAFLYAFTVVMIYPYLPGSGSAVFRGVSVFMGVIISFGSSSAIGNIIAGMVITYMRPFKVGDMIKIGSTMGFVVEKSLIVIKLRTTKNEFVTFPNTMILSSSVTNYHTSTDEARQGLILYADVTMNYQVPWRTVHEIMISAARATEGIEQDPAPFVLQTALDDFYCRYQINGHTRDADHIPAIYSRLFQNLQDGFAAAGIDLTAPHYRLHLPTESHHPPAG